MFVGLARFELATPRPPVIGITSAAIRPSAFPLVKPGLRMSADVVELPRIALRGYTRGYISRVGKQTGGEPQDQLAGSRLTSDVSASGPVGAVTPPGLGNP